MFDKQIPFTREMNNIFDHEDILSMIDIPDETACILKAHLILEELLNCWSSQVTKTKWGHPLENSGQAGSCVFLIFLFKNQVFLLFKLTLNMAIHPVMTSIGVNMHQSPM